MAKKHTVSPGFRDGYSGRLVVDRYEFQGHIAGTADNHNAASISVDGALTNIVSPAPSNVQSALAGINTYIGNQVGVGGGFITVGDTYDTWHNADGNVNYDKTVPSLDTLLNPVFNAIINGTTIPSGFSRIKRGGIIVIKSGTYIIRNTINVPPGITLMGEGYGTKIVNATALDITVSPPVNGGANTYQPLFRIKADLTSARTINDGVLDNTLTNLIDFQRQTRITNMVISDNFVENTQVGDNNYKLPQNKVGANPLIIQEAGSNCLIDNVMMTGRVIYSTGNKVVNSATRFAVGFDQTTTSGTGTYLQIKECIIDGFSQPVSYLTTGWHRDFLEITNCKIRSMGYLDNDGTSIPKNCIIAANACNTRIVNNHLWGNHINCRTILYIASADTTTDVQSRTKVLVTSNTIAIDKANSSTPTLLPTSLDASISGSTKISIFDAFNNFQFDSSSSFYVPNALTLGSSLLVSGSLEAVGSLKFDSSLYINTGAISASYTVDTSGANYILFVDTSVGTSTISITLPAATTGRELVIKDIGGNAQTNNIVLVKGAASTIDGYPSNKTIATNYASVTLVAYNSSWWIK